MDTYDNPEKNKLGSFAGGIFCRVAEYLIY